MTGRRRLAAVVIGGLAAVVVVTAGLAGCGSSSDDDVSPFPTAGTLAPATGDECTDPSGDLDLPVGVSADAPGLSGIDLVEASADLVGDQVDISITAAGPIAQAPAATYVVAQGEPLGALSFELRMVHGTDGWTTTLITWPKGAEVRTQVAVTPSVEGSTLTAAIPESSVPAVALALQFGTSAKVGDVLVVDDCSSLAGG